MAEGTKWLQTHVGLHPEQPFCLSVHFDKPHFPFNPPLPYFSHYAGKTTLPVVPDSSLEGAVPFVRRAGRHFDHDADLYRRALAAYYGCVEWVDNAIGRLLDVLAYLGLAERTLVVYASDHGEMAARHGFWHWKYNWYLDGNAELYDLESDPDEWNNLAADPGYARVASHLHDRVVQFWQPERQVQRYQATPSMAREKHFYEFSNQFLLGDGTVVDARP